MVLVRDLDVLHPRLEKHHLIPPKQRRERDVHLRIRQIHPHARPRPAAKGRQLFVQLGAVGSQPAVRVEEGRVDEDGRVVVHVHVVHRDGRVGRHDPVSVPERGGRGDAGHAADDAVGHAETLFDDGAEVGEPFEVLPQGHGAAVRDRGPELGKERVVNGGRVEHVEGDDREGVAGRFVPGHDEQDAFVREPVQALLFRGHFFVVRHFVEDGRDGLLGSGLDDGRFGLAGLGDLLLNHLFFFSERS